MAYEVYKRTAVRVGQPTLSITRDGRIALNAAAVREILRAGVKTAALLWDQANNRVALKAAPKTDRNAYAISISGSTSGVVRAKGFLAHIGWNAPERTTMPATWNEVDRMLEVTLPQECLFSRRGGDPKRKPTDDL